MVWFYLLTQLNTYFIHYTMNKIIGCIVHSLPKRLSKSALKQANIPVHVCGSFGLKTVKVVERILYVRLDSLFS